MTDKKPLREAYVLAHIDYKTMAIDNVRITSDDYLGITQDFSTGVWAQVLVVTGTDFGDAVKTAEEVMEKYRKPLFDLYKKTR